MGANECQWGQTSVGGGKRASVGTNERQYVQTSVSRGKQVSVGANECQWGQTSVGGSKLVPAAETIVYIGDSVTYLRNEIINVSSVL